MKSNRISDKWNDELEHHLVNVYREQLPIFFNGTEFDNMEIFMPNLKKLLFLEEELKESIEKSKLFRHLGWTKEDVRYFSYDIIVEIVYNSELTMDISGMLLSELIRMTKSMYNIK